MSSSGKWIALVVSSFEAWCHHLLFVRQLYPSETFISARVLGVSVKKCGHPMVSKYITEMLRLGIPCLSTGICSGMSLQILIDPTHLAETYTLNFERFSQQPNKLSAERNKDDIGELERCLRDLLLSVLELERRPSTIFTDASTFNIVFTAAQEPLTKGAAESPIHVDNCDKIIPIFNGVVAGSLKFFFVASLTQKQQRSNIKHSVHNTLACK
jgi:HORMA domain